MLYTPFLPARASEQGIVFGSARIYIYVCTKKIVFEQTIGYNLPKICSDRLLSKIISPSAGKNSGDSV